MLLRQPQLSWVHELKTRGGGPGVLFPSRSRVPAAAENDGHARQAQRAQQGGHLCDQRFGELHLLRGARAVLGAVAAAAERVYALTPAETLAEVRQCIPCRCLGSR